MIDCSEVFCRRGVVEGFNNIVEMMIKGVSRLVVMVMVIVG